MRHILLLVINLFIFLNFSFSQEININEILASNQTILADEADEYDDYIEIFNSGNVIVNVADLYITDNEDNPGKFRIADTNPTQTTILPGGFLILWADNDPEQGILHLNFRLSKDGDYTGIYLLKEGEYQVVDELSFGEQQDDISYGRETDGGENFVYFETPTPGSSNSGTVLEILQEPEISHLSGFYTNNFNLTINSPDIGVDIYYTLDGSDPDENSIKYSGPIEINSLVGTPNGISTIRTTCDQGFYYWRNPEEEVFKATVIKARTVSGSNSFSEIVTRTYFVDHDINDKFSMPVISLITDSLNLFSADSGIYVPGNSYDGNDWRTANFSLTGSDWERLVHIEFFNEDGQLILSQNSGVRISGHGSRTTCIKTLRLYARKEYGANRFEYQFFPEERINNFKRLLLRNSGQDASFTYFRDAFISCLANEMDIDNMAYQTVVVFINGEYWGIHNLRERQDKYYIENHYSVNENELDLLELNEEIVEGDNIHYKIMNDFLRDNDLSEDQNYKVLDTLMDIESFMRYSTLILFAGNVDWPQNNIKYWRKRTPSYVPDAEPGHDGRWRWLLYDMDYGFGRVNSYSFNSLDYVLNEQSGWSTRLIQSLLGGPDKPGNHEYRIKYINYFADQLNTNLSSRRLLDEIENFTRNLTNEMQNHIDRWGNISSINTWENYIDVLREFSVMRQAEIRKFMMEEFEEISDTISLSLDVSNHNLGYIKINSTQINNLTPGIDSNVYPWEGIYFADIPIRLEAIPMDGYKFVRWDGINVPDSPVVNVVLTENVQVQAVFESKTSWSKLVINEINYNPDSQQGGDNISEFIELVNQGNIPISLGNYYFGSGIEFNFPNGSYLNSGDYLIIAGNSETYSGQGYLVYEWQGSLSNSGELITLFDSGGNLVDSVQYADGGLWPGNPDGFGFSLELKDPMLDNSRYQNWRASYIQGGTPGRENSQYINLGMLVINEVLSNGKHYISDESGGFDDWIEIYNKGSVELNVGGLYMSDINNISDLSKISLANIGSTIIPPGGFLQIWADNQPYQGILHMDFKLNAGGEKVFLFKVDNKKYSIIDSITIPRMEDDVSFGRYPDGASEFIKLDLPSPGATNLINDTVGGLVINEFMAINTNSFANENGEFEDWIEIHNYSDNPVDVGGLFITDSLEDIYKSRIPLGHSDSTSIPPNGFLRLWADNQSELSLLHIDLKLSGSGEQLGLVQMLKEPWIIDSLTFGIQTDGLSFGRFPDGSANLDFFSVPTPATANYSNGELLFNSLVINEFMARNTNNYQDEFGNYEDWIEIYNKGSEKVDIGGLYTTDNLNDPAKSRIKVGRPDITIIQPGSFFVLFADNKPELGLRHMEFQLMGAGEQLGLACYKNGEIAFVDSITYPVQTANISYGRNIDAGSFWQYYSQPTPGASNKLLFINEITVDCNTSLDVYPNPFSNHLNIRFNTTDYMDNIEVVIYSINGVMIKKYLIIGLLPGKHSLEWNGLDKNGSSINPGVYYIRLSAQNFINTKKVVFVK